jgi:hypothetical protein
MDFADPGTAPTILPFTKFEIMGESEMLWARLLAYVTGTVNQELWLRNKYLAAENRILRGQIKGGLLLSEGEKATLAEIAHRLKDSVEGRWRTWRQRPSRIRFWVGIGSSWRTNLMGRNSVNLGMTTELCLVVSCHLELRNKRKRPELRAIGFSPPGDLAWWFSGS